MSIKVYNTLTRRTEDFIPTDSRSVRMFVCGPTVYGPSHVGHAKTYTQFDFIVRYLRKSGYAVTYAQNITDIDDKIIRRATELGLEPRELAVEYEAHYLADMAALHNNNVDVYARAHDHIDDIVAQVQELVRRGHAYSVDGSWYFDLSTFSAYGQLSGRTQAREEDSVSRVDDMPQKRNPGDFVLWKARKEGEPFWETPLGQGRPGWHIEDTAITDALFGPQYDIHGGATDLMFPHHEAEIAQMEGASGKTPLARYWMHTGLLRTAGKKMAKSSGNFLTIREALRDNDYRTLRYAFLSQHYRSSIELTPAVFDSARSARRRIENFYRGIDASRLESRRNAVLADEARTCFYTKLDDDFDTVGALSALFGYIREQNKVAEPPGTAAQVFIEEVEELFDAFELNDASAHNAEIDGLLERRTQLRQDGKFAEADAVRDTLASLGVIVEDGPHGTRLRKKQQR
ncbi:cysteine--tRNA ligase [Streptomyces sp. NPDC096538]|uniref:cysteine--tRNA ligase n=1 Tax=Streptomyces sp. NPDC096538 TaxID=3155427 RepID=UPI00331C9299